MATTIQIKKKEKSSYDKEYYLKTKDVRLMQARKRREVARKAVIDHLGGKCKRCGYDDVRALQIDHVNGGGVKDRGSGNLYYYYRIIGDTVGTYQILCANCNIVKKIEKKEFGHRFTNYGQQ